MGTTVDREKLLNTGNNSAKKEETVRAQRAGEGEDTVRVNENSANKVRTEGADVLDSTVTIIGANLNELKIPPIIKEQVVPPSIEEQPIENKEETVAQESVPEKSPSFKRSKLPKHKFSCEIAEQTLEIKHEKLNIELKFKRGDFNNFTEEEVVKLHEILSKVADEKYFMSEDFRKFANECGLEISEITAPTMRGVMKSQVYGLPLADDLVIKNCTFCSNSVVNFVGKNLTFENCQFVNDVSIVAQGAQKISLNNCALPAFIDPKLKGDDKIKDRTRSLKFIGKTEGLTLKNSYGLIDQSLIKIKKLKNGKLERQKIDFQSKDGKTIPPKEILSKYRGSILKKGNMPDGVYNNLLNAREEKDLKNLNHFEMNKNICERVYKEESSIVKSLEKEQETMNENWKKKGLFGLRNVWGKIKYFKDKLLGKGKQSDIDEHKQIKENVEKKLIQSENGRRLWKAYYENTCNENENLFFRKVTGVSLQNNEIIFTENNRDEILHPREERIKLSQRERFARLGIQVMSLGKIISDVKKSNNQDLEKDNVLLKSMKEVVWKIKNGGLDTLAEIKDFVPNKAYAWILKKVLPNNN